MKYLVHLSIPKCILVILKRTIKRATVSFVSSLHFNCKYYILSANQIQTPLLHPLKSVFFSFGFLFRLLDSMKVPGQRSSFHICDILDLNNGSDTKGNQNNNNNNNHSTSNNNSNTNTTFPPQTSPPASRDGDSITNLNGKSTFDSFSSPFHPKFWIQLH